MPVVSDTKDTDSDTVDIPATAEHHDETLAQQSTEKKTRHAKLLMSADQEESLIDWVRESPCLCQKGLREYTDTKKRSRLWAENAAEVEMTGESSFYFFNFVICVAYV